jgi:RimJ/RimL family protein N-acetyltransferase
MLTALKWVNDRTFASLRFIQPQSVGRDRKWFASKRRDRIVINSLLNDLGVQSANCVFDISGDGAEIDVSVDKDERKKGYGSLLISLGIKELIQTVPVQVVHAYIKPDNHASIKSFQKANFANQGLEVVKGISAVHLLWRHNA